MTIALHILTRASRLLLLACFFMLLLAHLSVLLLLRSGTDSFMLIGLILACSFCSASYLSFKYWQDIQQSQQLSISATGEMILHLKSLDAEQLTGLNVRLSHKSRIWPYFLSIFLLDEAGKEHKLLILPDSLSPAEFRSLRVSLIWISQHGLA
ncbi:protein YgfX [Undibacterium sp. JH2W]|uniref:protein YgfX n=1 Tax=Undibacterium sp. JH2W TaxID=3413037 RepID=UPI003BF2BC4C